MSSFLSYGGRLVLVNYVFSSQAIYHMASLKLPAKVIKHIDRLRMHALWHGADINRKGGYLVAWKQVCRPKQQGGLGILNLCLQNKAMLMKHLHKFLNRADIPWVQLTWQAFYHNRLALRLNRMCGSFWWKDLLRLLEEFKGFSRCEVFDGRSCLFWKDMWNIGYPTLNWPHLFSFAKHQDSSVAQFLDYSDLLQNFQLPLSPTARWQFQCLCVALSSFELDQDRSDAWSYIWDSSSFSSKQAYA